MSEARETGGRRDRFLTGRINVASHAWRREPRISIGFRMGVASFCLERRGRRFGWLQLRVRFVCVLVGPGRAIEIRGTVRSRRGPRAPDETAYPRPVRVRSWAVLGQGPGGTLRRCRRVSRSLFHRRSRKPPGCREVPSAGVFPLRRRVFSEVRQRRKAPPFRRLFLVRCRCRDVLKPRVAAPR